MVASAKSWLCHPGVDRQAAILPWGAPSEVPRLSPVDASAEILTHLRQAWDAAHPEAPLRAQDVAMLAAAGITEIAVHAAPKVTILATGDEVVPPDTKALAPGQVRDALSTSIGVLVREAGGIPAPAAIIPDALYEAAGVRMIRTSSSAPQGASVSAGGNG